MYHQLVHWDAHSKTIHVHEKQTAKSLRDRCLFNLRPEVRSQFGVYIKSSFGEETLLNDNDEFGNHLEECKFIDFKLKSLKRKGLQAKMRLSVNHEYGPVNKSPCSFLVLYWDIENCPIPKNSSGLKIIESLRDLFRTSFTEIEIYIVCGKAQVSPEIRQMGSTENVHLIVVDNKGKGSNDSDAMIKKLMSENSAFCKPGTVYALITGDQDFGSDLYSLTYKKGFVTILIHNSLANHDLLLWSAVSFLFEELCKIDMVPEINLAENGKRNKNSTNNRVTKEVCQKKIQETCEDRALEDVDLEKEKDKSSLACKVDLGEQDNDSTNVGEDELNFQLKCTITQENGTSSRTQLAEDFSDKSFLACKVDLGEQDNDSPNVGEDELNFQLKSNLTQENGTSLRTLPAEDFSCPPGKRIKVRFCNKDEELLVYPWDTVGLLKQQIAYPLINEENKEFDTDLISCTTNDGSAKIPDVTVIFDLIESDKEIILTFGSVAVRVLQTKTYLSCDSPLDVKALTQPRTAEAVFLWDMTKKSCRIPDNKKCFHPVKRTIDRFCSGCKIKESIAFIDEMNVEGNNQSFSSFSSVVTNVYTTNIKSKMEEVFKKFRKHVMYVVISGNQEVAEYIEDLKRANYNILLIPSDSIKHRLSAPVECTFEELTSELPDNLSTITDLAKQVVVETKVENKAFKRERQITFSQNNAYTKHPYETGTFQTTTAAKNFKEIMDGNEICGLPVKANISDEIENNKKGNDSLPEEREVPPVADAVYEGNLQVIIKKRQKKPPVAQVLQDVSSSQYKPAGLCLDPQDARKDLSHKLMGPDPQLMGPDPQDARKDLSHKLMGPDPQLMGPDPQDATKELSHKLMGPDHTDKYKQFPVVETDTGDCEKRALSESGIPLIKTSLSQETQDEKFDLTIDDKQEQCGLSEGETPNV
ncbi:unnamed protein product [Lymnaea stagnalis]|uniref:NYN domain-containing protein n=1 Tax=Lymnaea stagnalis TaxID=6523 RepID=A0AAV2HWR9_LYMST